MSGAEAVQPEPQPLRGAILFEEGDFHALSEGLSRDPQYDDRRLVTRRKLAALARQVEARASAEGARLETRTSLHRPHVFNGNRVRRLWAYITRPASERKRLRGILGPELGKDLDAAYRNAYLCLAIEENALEASLRIHPDAWYDGQNLVNRVKHEGLRVWQTLLNQLPGFQLRLHDWKGEWPCGALTPDRLEEFLRYYVPGEHLLAVERRWPAPQGSRAAACAPEAPAQIVEDAMRLLPLWRFSAWSRESDELFAR